MTIPLSGSGGLFTILGKLFYVQDTINTAVGSTVPTTVNSFITAIEALSDTPLHTVLIDGIQQSENGWQRANSLTQYLSQAAQRILVQMVLDDVPLPSPTVSLAVAELISQMNNSSDTVKAETVGIAVNSIVSDGDHVVAASALDGYGFGLQHLYPETINVTVSSTSGNGSFRFRAPQAAQSILGYDWPQGSGCDLTLGAVGPDDGGELVNGSFDTANALVPQQPDSWICSPATVGTTLYLSSYETQTVVIAGTPTTGTYALTVEALGNNAQTTPPLAFNATQATVQAALRALIGFEQVTVVTTGTVPNYTHTVQFVNVRPAPNTQSGTGYSLITAANTFDTGTITVTETVTGTPEVYRGRALGFDNDNSEQTAIYQRLDGLSVLTPYVFKILAMLEFDASDYPTTGSLHVDLVDGIGGNVITNQKGVQNKLVIDLTSGGLLTNTAYVPFTAFFALPQPAPPVVYLRIWLSTVMDKDTLWIDDVSIVQATQLYAGGPYVGLFAGGTAIGLDDAFTVVPTNNYAGKFQIDFMRNGLTQFGQLLPSVASGNTIDEALIG